MRIGMKEYLKLHPAVSYLICCCERTGSTLLGEALAGTGIAGRPFGYFSRVALYNPRTRRILTQAKDDDTYLDKAGNRARHAVGQRLEIQEPYLREGWLLIGSVVRDRQQMSCDVVCRRHAPHGHAWILPHGRHGVFMRPGEVLFPGRPLRLP